MLTIFSAIALLNAIIDTNHCLNAACRKKLASVFYFFAAKLSAVSIRFKKACSYAANAWNYGQYCLW
jgi:hypothetical protein